VEHLRPLLEAATTVELLDWPHQDVPAALIRAGYSVVGHEPFGYKTYAIVDDEPAGRVFPVSGGGYLATVPLEALPDKVEIVNAFRPADEQPDIARGAVAIGASVLWIQPGVSASEEARVIAEAAGLSFVDGVDIASAVRDLDIHVLSR
jgi:predicted CoA-binding protein